jgi:hypothetical protein
MRYLIVILGLMFVACEKGELADCRDCVATTTILSTNETTYESFVDCQNSVREDDRTYLEGQILKRRVVRCNPPK